jgi:uncharacterized repeat protein (TIGR01451 family)
VLRRRVLGPLTLLGTALALSGAVRAQGTAPAPAPPGLELSAVPLNADNPVPADQARRIIASSRPGVSSVVSVPVPDDGLTFDFSSIRTHPQFDPPRSTVRTAIYRPELDGGPVVQVGGRSDAKGGSEAAARLDLHVDGPTEVVPGRPFAYAIRVRSIGNVPAGSVRVTDRLPPGTHLLSAEPKAEVAGDRVSWDLGDLPPGEERRLKVAIDAERSTVELLICPSASFGIAPGLRVAPGRPALQLRLTGPEAAPPGVVVPYRVQLANNGASALSHVVVLVKLTPGLSHPQMGNGDAIEADVTLASGETKTLPLDLQAGPAGPNVVAATALADGGLVARAQAKVLVDRAAPAASVLPRAVPRLRVEINKLGDGLTVGGTAVYEIRLSNPDDSAQTGLRLLTQLSEGLEPEQADGPTASAQQTHGVVFETLGRLAPGETAVYHLRVLAKRAGVQQLRAEVNADRQAQPVTAELSTWITPGRGW